MSQPTLIVNGIEYTRRDVNTRAHAIADKAVVAASTLAAALGSDNYHHGIDVLATKIAADLHAHKGTVAQQRDRLVTAMSLEGTNQSLDSAVSVAVSRLSDISALRSNDAVVRQELARALELNCTVDSTRDLAKRVQGLCIHLRNDNRALARAPGEAREALAKALGISPEASSLEGMLLLVTDRIKNDAKIIRGQQEQILRQSSTITTNVGKTQRIVEALAGALGVPCSHSLETLVGMARERLGAETPTVANIKFSVAAKQQIVDAYSADLDSARNVLTNALLLPNSVGLTIPALATCAAEKIDELSKLVDKNWEAHRRDISGKNTTIAKYSDSVDKQAKTIGDARRRLSNALGLPDRPGLDYLIDLTVNKLSHQAKVIHGNAEPVLATERIDNLLAANERLVEEVRTLNAANANLAGEVHRLCAATGPACLR